jgi:hypothetical protein
MAITASIRSSRAGSQALLPADISASSSRTDVVKLNAEIERLQSIADRNSSHGIRTDAGSALSRYNRSASVPCVNEAKDQLRELPVVGA